MEKPNTNTPIPAHIDTMEMVHDLSMSASPGAAAFGRCAKALMEAQTGFLKDEMMRQTDPNVAATAYLKEAIGPFASFLISRGLKSEPEVVAKEIATYFQKTLLETILVMQGHRTS